MIENVVNFVEGITFTIRLKLQTSFDQWRRAFMPNIGNNLAIKTKIPGSNRVKGTGAEI